LSQHDFPPHFLQPRLLQHFDPQAGSQAGSQQAGSQAGSQQAGSQAAGSQHAFSQQAGSGAQQACFSQQPDLQPDLQENNPFIPANRSRRLQHFSHEAVSQQPWSPHAAGSQHAAAWSQQAGSQHWPQPPRFRPTMFARSSKPNPWVVRAALSRSAPNTILPFIEQTLLIH
jgi:hypothetical protein